MAAPNDETDDSPVHLGFCEPIQDAQHASEIAHNSPYWSDWDGGQVGGRPSWLNPRDLPLSPLCCTHDDCTSTPMRFICQLYAPADTVNTNAFHRTLYVFACPICSSVRVIRTQLAQENDFFPASQDTTTATTTTTESWSDPEMKLCKVCGQRGKGVCPLQQESFCSKHHQKEYKKHVFDVKEENGNEAVLPSVYPMYELVVEEEPSNGSTAVDDSNRKTMFESNDNDNDGDSDQDLEQDDLNRMTGANQSENKDDATTDAFFLRVERAKDQCIRYHQWQDDAPLWISGDNIPTAIPDCEYCGAPRRFEFQLMPQLLHYLKQSSNTTEPISKQQKEALLAASTIVEKTDPNEMPAEFKETHDKAVQNIQSKILGNTGELDWGVVVVYTCTASCGGSDDGASNANEELGAYREEYAWVQLSLG